jgi:diguanylate cyclase (GGDEF)-like protein/putative nucleotidyltransferase with HDIG domain
LNPTDLVSLLGNPILRCIAFVAGTGFLLNFLYLRRLLHRADPNQIQAAPQNVRAALDTLAEGVLVLDSEQRIVLANEAFAKLADRSPAELQGMRATELPWAQAPNQDNTNDYPWVRALREGASQTGTALGLRLDGNNQRILSVNSTPILGNNGCYRGTLATFDDLTLTERKNTHLRKLLQKLKVSRMEIRRQNQELRELASTDPLTGCLNRRSFFEQFEINWSAAQRHGHGLSCVMVDIDHFKAINDRHGHAIGDQVLQQVATFLKAMARQSDSVCRYGGEEFCVLMPCTDLAEAAQAAERFRQKIASCRGSPPAVTASFGVSALSLGARQPCELIDQADKALYVAKRDGRNRVIRWDEAPDGLETAGTKNRHTNSPANTESEIPIPFHAVTALVSALAYRHPDTAEHSRRVADLCVATATGLVSQCKCYVLEVAALLHDVGKLGVPDAVLLKPGPLTDPEWKVIRTHESIGVEIITASFSSKDLTDVICNHHAWYGGSPHDPDLPKGLAIPLGARILAIADAFDAMVSNRVYRQGRSHAAAFAELRRCAGAQFDPELVERFITVVAKRDAGGSLPALFLAKQTALRIGMQIEKLAHALDARDLQTLSTMACRLHATAEEHGVTEIAQPAARLASAARSNSAWPELVQLTIDLLELCRLTYSSYVPKPGPVGFLPFLPQPIFTTNGSENSRGIATLGSNGNKAFSNVAPSDS